MTSKLVEVTIIVVEVRVVFAEGIRRGLAAKVEDHLDFGFKTMIVLLMESNSYEPQSSMNLQYQFGVDVFERGKEIATKEKAC